MAAEKALAECGLATGKVRLDPSSAERIDAWIRMSRAIRSGPEAVRRELAGADFFPKALDKESEDAAWPLSRSLIRQAARARDTEAFVALCEAAVDPIFGEGMEGLSHFLRQGLPFEWSDAQGRRWEGLEEAAEQDGPLAACLREDSAECLAALMDHPAFGPALLRGEPEPLPEDGSSPLERRDRSAGERSVLVHALRETAGRCAALACALPEWSDNILSNRVGLWDFTALALCERPRLFALEHDEEVGFSGFSAVLAAEVRAEQTWCRSDEAKEGLRKAAAIAVRRYAELPDPRPQFGSGLNWMEHLADEMFKAGDSPRRARLMGLAEVLAEVLADSGSAMDRAVEALMKKDRGAGRELEKVAIAAAAGPGRSGPKARL